MAQPNTHNRVIELIKDLDRNIKIVDLGCGKGEIVTKLRELGFKSIKYCGIKNNFDKDVKIMDLNKKSDYADNSFDLVISTEVVEHLKNKCFFFEEIKRILKKEGSFIFSTPNLSNVFNRLYYLFKGRFIDFDENEPKHINPFFIQDIPSYFTLKKITYNRGFIPVLRLPFINNGWFGQTLIYYGTG